MHKPVSPVVKTVGPYETFNSTGGLKDMDTGNGGKRREGGDLVGSRVVCVLGEKNQPNKAFSQGW